MENNDKKLKPLLLSFWTPPAIRPQAMLLSKMVPEWLNQGAEPLIVGYEGLGEWNTKAKVVHISQPPYSKIFSRFRSLAYLLEDRYFDRIAKQIAKEAKKHGCNVIYGFAKPHDVNVVGAKLKKMLGIPFVAHFSDPWLENWYGSSAKARLSRIKKQERKIVEAADKVVSIAEPMGKMILGKYKKEIQDKLKVVDHCYDPALYPKINRNDENFVISHIGIMRKNRNPEVLFQAISILLRDNKLGSKKLKVELVGAINEYTDYTEKDFSKLVSEYNLQEHVKLVEKVKFEESLAKMVESDLLVVIDENIPKCTHILSKTIDYLGSGTPIVGIMPHDNPTAKLIEDSGYKSFSYEQPEKLAQFILNIYNKSAEISPKQDVIDSLSVQNTTKRLFSIFRSLTSQKLI